MKKTLFLLFGTYTLYYSQNVGINTYKPDASAILEISADAPLDETSTAKKGLLLPRVALLNKTDQQTIPSPAKGLLIYNTATAGSYPNDVSSNQFYYWDGTQWERFVFKSIVEEAIKSRFFYIESSNNQSINASDINFLTAGEFKKVVVTFSENAIANIDEIITQNSDSSFTINKSGLYEFSAFINFNPMKSSSSAFINLTLQISKDNGNTWNDSAALTRTAWGNGAATYLKTATIQAFPLMMEKGTKFRLVFFSPFNNGGFGNAGTPYIGTTSLLPVSKGIKAQLLDFNL